MWFWDASENVSESYEIPLIDNTTLKFIRKHSHEFASEFGPETTLNQLSELIDDSTKAESNNALLKILRERGKVSRSTLQSIDDDAREKCDPKELIQILFESSTVDSCDPVILELFHG